MTRGHHASRISNRSGEGTRAQWFPRLAGRGAIHGLRFLRPALPRLPVRPALRAAAPPQDPAWVPGVSDVRGSMSNPHGTTHSSAGWCGRRVPALADVPRARALDRPRPGGRGPAAGHSAPGTGADPRSMGIRVLLHEMECAYRNSDLAAAAALIDFPLMVMTGGSGGGALDVSLGPEQWLQAVEPRFNGQPAEQEPRTSTVVVITESIAWIEDDRAASRSRAPSKGLNGPSSRCAGTASGSSRLSSGPAGPGRPAHPPWCARSADDSRPRALERIGQLAGHEHGRAGHRGPRGLTRPISGSTWISVRALLAM